MNFYVFLENVFSPYGTHCGLNGLRDPLQCQYYLKTKFKFIFANALLIQVMMGNTYHKCKDDISNEVICRYLGF